MILTQIHDRAFVVCLLLCLLICSCEKKNNIEKWRYIEISPEDKSQVITIITLGNNRYFMDGKHRKIPNDGYLLLDISEVDRLGDGISVCWNETSYKWKISSAYAKLIENKLDTFNFLYFQPIGEYGEPISKGYLGDNCGGILIRENLNPRGNVKINYIDDISEFMK